jgi:hypothetical protein|nr:MAG TPA: hypothetical protein [Caudoviricetes sp.]
MSKWEAVASQRIPTGPCTAGSARLFTCNECKHEEPCQKRTEGCFLPKECVRLGNTVFTSTIKVPCVWHDEKGEVYK